MYLMQGVPPFNPDTTTAGARAASALLANVFAAPAAQAQLSQQQTAAKYAPQAAQADIAQKLALAQMYGGKNDYYTGGANLKNTQAGAITTGGNTPVADAVRLMMAANQSGDPTQINAAYLNLNNALTLPQSEIAKNVGAAQGSQAGAALSSAKAVNEGAPGGYVSPQLPIMPRPMISNTPGAPMLPAPNSAPPVAGGVMQGQAATPQGAASAPTQYANQMGDADIVKSIMNNQLPPLQPVGGGGGIALKAQSVNAQKQMDSMQTFPNKIQAMADFYSNPDTQGYVGPDISKGGVARGVGNVMNMVGAAPDSYNTYQTGRTNALLAGEGLSQLAVPGTRSGTLIAKNIEQISPDQVKNPQAAYKQLQEIATANIQDLTGYIKGNYLPSVRQGAMLQLQAAMKYPIYQQAYAQLQQGNPQGAPGSASAPAAAKVLTYNPATGALN